MQTWDSGGISALSVSQEGDQLSAVAEPAYITKWLKQDLSELGYLDRTQLLNNTAHRKAASSRLDGLGKTKDERTVSSCRGLSFMEEVDKGDLRFLRGNGLGRREH